MSLLDENRKILYKVAGTYAHDASDRQDLVQEMVFQLWRSFGTRPPASDRTRDRLSFWT